MLAIGPERSRRLAGATLGTLSRVPMGLQAIDFLGHMGPDPRLRRSAGSIELTSPVGLGSMIDPAGDALPAFSRFGAGMLEVGPVAGRPNNIVPDWRVDLQARTVVPASEIVVGLDDVARNLERVPSGVNVCVRIAAGDPASVANIVARLQSRAAILSVDADDLAAAIGAAGGRPVLLSIRADAENARRRAMTAVRAGAAGVSIRGGVEETVPLVESLRKELPRDAIIVAGGVTQPDDVRRLLAVGADVAVIDAGLICSGPGLVKRCNEALLSTVLPSARPEPLTLDAARSAWFWALLLGVAMFAGGLLAIVIASTGIVLPYDESMSGMTHAQLRRINPRILPFMAHDRVSLAGSMLSVGIFYAALAWSGIRRGAHWAHATVIASATVGFLSFFYFLGFGYFDPFHAFVTAILTQFTLLCMALPRSPAEPPQPEWRESAAWRRGQWGQLLFIMLGAGLTGAGVVISYVGCTQVFVETDLAFLGMSAATIHSSAEHLRPLIAHDRASLGGMLLANGVAVWLSAQWGFRKGERWLWNALAWGGNIAFVCAVVVHVVVGYGALLHLAPAFAGWAVWNFALLLTRGWLCAASDMSGR